ncbi:uncharacterized protein LOC135837410 [Planococcus citri]|uniref:uncharacterized protein LOC135837410 n=1 Tax=Planococcus citri TaxID=170843 RepID=UPI0031F7305C
MQPGCYGYSISTASVFVLYSTLVINVVILTSLSFDDQANENLLGSDFQTKKRIILLQTILAVFATIMYFNSYTSAVMILWKFWVFGAILMTLFFDLMSAITTALHLTLENGLDHFWSMQESTKTAPNALYVLVISVIIFYFVFKLHVAIVLFNCGDNVTQDMWNNAYLVSDEDIERNIPSEQVTVLPTPPPQYDQCVLEWEKPPPYSSLLITGKS